ncbi:AAA family ATPase [Porticoccus sp. W117]|uniref:ExeA family protein n=1 Tax=Porticoccus sp. W117 TaxID=3054777 RepID=UPI002596E6E8|nr:AAA family ATPase [Porticoccus sp. W117]MDM3870897.1 AAA family ATPase [Porticoccus sp. W117]
MYERYFQLREKPFSLTPDTQFFFNRQSHRGVLNTLTVALQQREGFIKVVGEVGTGKTLLCRKLLAGLGEGYQAAYIPNPYLTPEELRFLLAEEIGADVNADMPGPQVLSNITRRLVDLAADDKQVVMVIDEAQAMPRDTIEALRLLSNLETEKRKLLQVVLFGQPELDSLLNRKDLRQLKQRIIFSEYLTPFDKKGVRHYINHRLTSAGHPGAKLFTRSAIGLLYRASGGVPRPINVLAHKAMIACYGRGDRRITSYHIARAIQDTPESKRIGKLLALRWHLLWPLVGALSLAGTLVYAQGGAI